jgi:hypothetical protein
MAKEPRKQKKKGGRYVVISRKWLIQDPNGTPGETIEVDELPPDRAKAHSEAMFNAVKSVLARRINEFLARFKLDIDDFCQETQDDFVRAYWHFLFACGEDGQEKETLCNILEKVMTRKIEVLEQQLKKKPSPRKK